MKCKKTTSQTNEILVSLKTENIAYNRSFLRNVFYEKSRILLKTLEDLKVLRRSPDLLNNVKIGQGQLQLIMEQILFGQVT